MAKPTKKALDWMKLYTRYTDYIGAAQLYLKDNFQLEEELSEKHIKERILGHWGTVPGLNVIYAGLNWLISNEKCEMMIVTGPGHGAPAILANVFAEGALDKVYPRKFPVNGKGMGKVIKDFSWPHSLFPSHVTPTVPGSILEGGELGYSLATAYGAILDNPNLIAAVVVGDGEAETGPTATAWHSNKFVNPRTSGAVLPIVHINGFKISNPTIYGRMDDEELTHLFKGYGYEPIIVKAPNLHKKYLEALDKAYKIIRAVQKKARSSKKPLLKAKMPVILLISEKGRGGVHKYAGHLVEGSFHSHGIPIGHPKENPEAMNAIKKWLKSYKVHELLDKKGAPLKEVIQFVPKGSKRMGLNKHAFGGDQYKKLKLPALSKYSVTCGERGCHEGSSMKIAGQFLRDLYKKNPKNFRIMCPDEMESNKLGSVFEQTKRAFMWPTNIADEQMSPDGRVMEMLSEHTLQGWMQGYILTGRHGMFVTYEAFAGIIGTMVDQHAKFLKQSFKVKWRKPVASAIYILSSVGWRQDHNGYSHQNPSFVSSVLQKHGDFCQIYYPADANSMLVALEECMTKKDGIAVIVAGKRDLPQWLSLKEAREQAKTGIAIWDWVGGKSASKNPDVVLASAGDYITQEAICAVKLCKKLVPSLKVRYVNVSELTSICLGDACSGNVCMTESGVNHYFTAKKPVVFSYHGYVNDIEGIMWPYTSSDRFTIHGYRETGSTTTPFDIKISNGVSCYHLAIDLIKRGVKGKKRDDACAKLEKIIDEHQAYIEKYGNDPEHLRTI
ncbi:phosphoketolase family protein [Candidatus Gracilibacteria bacterium]|nr:phosphoketolase family protein [Candidatus Gracilibacteria bacterium]